MSIMKNILKKIEFLSLVVYEIIKELLKLLMKFLVKSLSKIGKKVILKLSSMSKRAIKMLCKKQNQRRLLYISGVLLIIGLALFATKQYIYEKELQKDLKTQIELNIKNEKSIESLSKRLRSLETELVNKDSLLQQKAASEAEKQSKIEDLQKKLDNAVLGKGGGSTGPIVVGTLDTNNGYAWGNCTAGVASWVDVPQNLGNAGDWGANAASMGYTVNETPTVNSVGYTTEGYYGHVVLVTDVREKTIDIKEMNYDGHLGVINFRTVTKDSFRYIHFTS